MTPQEKNVFGKLFTKTELATQKVDLALNDDVQKNYNSAIAARKKSADVYFTAKKAIENAITEIKSLKSINENALATFSKFDALIKELGIPYPQEQANQKTNIQDGLKGSFAQQIKSLESAKL
jgi:hypothetical protein